MEILNKMATDKKPEVRKSDESELVVSVDMPNGFTYTGKMSRDRPTSAPWLTLRDAITTRTEELVDTSDHTSYGERLIRGRSRRESYEDLFRVTNQDGTMVRLNTTSAVIHYPLGYTFIDPHATIQD